MIFQISFHYLDPIEIFFPKIVLKAHEQFEEFNNDNIVDEDHALMFGYSNRIILSNLPKCFPTLQGVHLLDGGKKTPLDLY